MENINTVTDSTRIQRLFPHFYKKIIPDGLESMCVSLHGALETLEQSIQREIIDVTNGKPLDDTEEIRTQSFHHSLNAKFNNKTPKKKKKKTKGLGSPQAKAMSVAENDTLQIVKRLQKLENTLRICHEDGTLLRTLNAELLPVSNMPTLQDATIHAILAQSISGFADSLPLRSYSNIIPPEFISDINHMVQVTEAWIQTSESALSFLATCKKDTLKHITGSNEMLPSIDKGIRAICDQAAGSMYVVVSAESLRSMESRQFAESVKAEMLNLNKTWARELSLLKSEVSDLEDLLVVPDSSMKALEHDTEMLESYLVAAVMTQEELERDEKPIGVLAAMMTKENALKALEDIYQGQLLKGSKECM
ncbi:hypothetical protein DER46DRAFT_656116 [Fusarium sp. MPI-SDFR-AT-0072]|nr:hypothetical protein DER46DRAFT_656116 [Fusarium sp. MPI-SDFR-AT-0072]